MTGALDRTCRICDVPRRHCLCEDYPGQRADYEAMMALDCPKVKTRQKPPQWTREQMALHLATVYADDPRMAQKSYPRHLLDWEDEAILGIETLPGGDIWHE